MTEQEISCNEKCNRISYTLRRVEKETISYISENFHKNNTTTTILDLIQKFKLTYRQANYLVNKLIKKEFVKNLEKSIFLLEPTQKADDYLKSVIGNLQSDSMYVNSLLDRAHRIDIIQPIIFRPEGVVPEGFTASSESNKLHWKYPQLTKKDKENCITVQVSDKSICYRFSECYGVNPHSIVFNCLGYCFAFGLALTKQGFRLDLPKTAVIEQHHAIFNKKVGGYTKPYKISYKSDRLSFDSSIKSNEFELTHPEHASDDFLLLTSFMESVIRKEIEVETLIELQKIMPDLQKLLQKQQGEVETVNGQS